MDYIINQEQLNSKKVELNTMKTNVVRVVNDITSGFKSVSSSEISSLITKINNSASRLQKGYENSYTWLNNYTTEINNLEDRLTNMNIAGITKPSEFKSEFIDIFSKQTMPLLKTGYEPQGFTIADSNGALTGLTFRGQDFNIVNTRIPVMQYAEYVQKNGLNQNKGLLGGQCMLLSQYYASDMISGHYTTRSTMEAHGGAPAVKMNEGVSGPDSGEVLNYVYNEINEGNPVVLQVSQVNSYKGERHLVTVVGYASSVKSASDLTPDNILVLDCVDGTIQTLGQARSEGGHERYVYAQGGKYLAYGPTEKFKASVGV